MWAQSLWLAKGRFRPQWVKDELNKSLPEGSGLSFDKNVVFRDGRVFLVDDQNAAVEDSIIIVEVDGRHDFSPEVKRISRPWMKYPKALVVEAGLLFKAVFSREALRKPFKNRYARGRRLIFPHAAYGHLPGAHLILPPGVKAADRSHLPPASPFARKSGILTWDLFLFLNVSALMDGAARLIRYVDVFAQTSFR